MYTAIYGKGANIDVVMKKCLQVRPKNGQVNRVAKDDWHSIKCTG